MSAPSSSTLPSSSIRTAPSSLSRPAPNFVAQQYRIPVLKRNVYFRESVLQARNPLGTQSRVFRSLAVFPGVSQQIELDRCARCSSPDPYLKAMMNSSAPLFLASNTSIVFLGAPFNNLQISSILPLLVGSIGFFQPGANPPATLQPAMNTLSVLFPCHARR